MHTKTDDEQEIRSLVAEWLAATKRGDVQTVLGLMTDDALFLVPGRPPMDKAAFAAASQFAPGARPVIESNSEIREIHVDGHMAWMVSRLTVDVTPAGSAPTIRREGHTLTVFRKVRDRWLLARDANLLVKV